MFLGCRAVACHLMGFCSRHCFSVSQGEQGDGGGKMGLWPQSVQTGASGARVLEQCIQQECTLITALGEMGLGPQSIQTEGLEILSSVCSRNIQSSLLFLRWVLGVKQLKPKGLEQ